VLRVATTDDLQLDYCHARHYISHLHYRKRKYRLARKRYGHWEGGSAVGAAQSGVIATFVERKSGYLMARLLPDKMAGNFAAAAAVQCWEYGTNENTNGLLRLYFPKSMSFAHLTQKILDEAVARINTRPRKRLGCKTPEQMFKAKW